MTTKTITLTFENGVFRPSETLELPEGHQITLTVSASENGSAAATPDTEVDDEERPWRGVMVFGEAQPKPSGPPTPVDLNAIPRAELAPNFSWTPIHDEDGDDGHPDAD